MRVEDQIRSALQREASRYDEWDSRDPGDAMLRARRRRKHKRVGIPILATLGLVVVVWGSFSVAQEPARSPEPTVPPAESVSPQIEGTWQVTAIELAGTEQAVTPGVNTVSPPWVAVEEGEITGIAGCNGIQGPFTVTDDGALSMGEVVMEAALCGPEDGSLMQTDSAFQAVMWGGTVDVSTEGEKMIWSNGSNSITFVSVASPPTTEPFTPPPVSRVGRLDCSPGFVSETRVPDTRQDPLDIAREADARVVSIQPGKPLWYSGVDSEGNVVVEMALGDVAEADYQVWTCED